MKEHTFAALHLHGLAVPQHPPIDREIAVSDFEAGWHPFSRRRLHRGLAALFQVFYFRRHQKILRHVATLAERWFELLERQEDFAIVSPRFLFRRDVHRSDLAAVLSGMQVRP